MQHFVYILESEIDGRFYIGQTQNVSKRLERHNKGYNKATKSKRPWKLLISVSVSNRAEAIKLERKLKSLKKRSSIIKFIEENS